MKDLKYKIVLLLFVVLIAVIIGLCFIIQEKNKEIQKEKTKINKLEEEIKNKKQLNLKNTPLKLRLKNVWKNAAIQLHV